MKRKSNSEVTIYYILININSEREFNKKNN